jgi:hypothetical protein
MRPPNKQAVLQQATEHLATLLGLPPTEAIVDKNRDAPQADLVIHLAGKTFFVECKDSGTLSSVAEAVGRIHRYARDLNEDSIPLLAVPFMGPAGREYCGEEQVGWLDLSGNAEILAPGIRVRLNGHPNRFKRPGRPSSVFAPKSSRIARWLLMHPHRAMTQREIARATDMDEGYTSRIVARLEEDGFIAREPGGAIRARDPDLLLDAWREDYDFLKHEIVRGHVVSRTSNALLQLLAEGFQEQETEYAATGLAAAWQLSRFAGFRTVTMYVADRPSPQVLEHMGFRESVPGANVWLVVPSDSGVFHGAADREGVSCVHPVQVYLDLKGHPERSSEAAAQLRTDFLRWRAD